MSILDELKKWTHPYDEDEDYDDEDELDEAPPRREPSFERVKSEDRHNKVVNIHATTQDIARRLIDFLSGVAYAQEGKIKKVAANTYIITPYHVDIEGDLIDELESSGMYF